MTMNLSLARAADKRVENAIEIWAPWMGEDERKELISNLNRLDLYERLPTVGATSDGELRVVELGKPT